MEAVKVSWARCWVSKDIEYTRMKIVNSGRNATGVGDFRECTHPITLTDGFLDLRYVPVPVMHPVLTTALLSASSPSIAERSAGDLTPRSYSSAENVDFRELLEGLGSRPQLVCFPILSNS